MGPLKFLIILLFFLPVNCKLLWRQGLFLFIYLFVCLFIYFYSTGAGTQGLHLQLLHQSFFVLVFLR
jgi:hypothetical protein